jgi:hypothetical protein
MALHQLRRPVALLSTLACMAPVFAAQTESETVTVPVKDINVRPMANLASDDDTFTIHPKVLVGVGYNTNVYAEPVDENQGFYYRGLAGVLLGLRLNEHSRLAFDGEAEGLAYLKEENDQANLAGGRASLDYLWQESRNSARVHAGYARFDDPLIQTGQQVLRETYDGYASLNLTGTVARNVIKVGGQRTDYLENALGFTEDSRDNNTFSVTLRSGCTHARDSFYYVLLGYENTSYDENTQFNDFAGYTAGLGGQVRLGERATATVEAGATYRVYANDYGGSAAYDDETVVAPYASLAIVVPWEEGSHFGAQAFSRLDESLTANAAWIYGVGVDARYRLALNAGLFGALMEYQSKDSGHGPGIAAEERLTTEAVIGVDYELCRGLTGRLKVNYTESDSELNNDFTRIIVAVDLAAAF